MSTVANIDKNDDENTDNIELQQLETQNNDNDNTNKLVDQIKNASLKDIDGGIIDMLDKDDFYKLLKENDIDMDRNILNTIFNIVDVNNDGYIEINDFLTWKTELDIISFQEVLNKSERESEDDDDDNVNGPPAYIGQSSLAIDEDIVVNDDQRDSLMKNQSNTKTSKEIGDLESNTPPSTERPSTERMGTGNTNITRTTVTTTEDILPAINEGDSNINDNDDDDEEEKYSSNQQQNKQLLKPKNSYDVHREMLAQQEAQYTTREYACKRCIRPVRNNVFMEKTVEECNPQEIKFEVERLICCLFFLTQEFNIFESLKGYLKSIENESKKNDVSSPYAFSQKSSDNNNNNDHDLVIGPNYGHTTYRSTTTAFVLYSQPMLKKSDTAQHIKWLHMAYVTERQERLSQKKLAFTNLNKKPPKFDNVINKGTLKSMYEYLKNIYRDTIYALTESYMRLNADKYDLKQNLDFTNDAIVELDNNHNNNNQHNEAQDKVNQEIKQVLKQRKLGDIGSDIIKRNSVNNNEIIKKASTYYSSMGSDDDANDELFGYEENKKKYDPIYSCTPTTDEMECYLSLCRIIFNDSLSSDTLSILGVSIFQKIRDAFTILRKSDHAIAQKTNGWVTTIDNILCVLLYRDLNSYRRNFIGELQMTLVIEGTKTTKLENYENRALLRVIKNSIIDSFCGIPTDPEAKDNQFEVDDIILRDKIAERSNICSCCTDSNLLVRLTFGIQCDDSKFNFGFDGDGNQNKINYKLLKQYPYKFLYQSKRLFSQIYRKDKYFRLFDASARKYRAQIKLADIHTYDLNIYQYPKTEMDILLTKQFSIPSTNINDINNNTTSSQNNKIKLQNLESQRSQRSEIFLPQFGSFDSSIYKTTTTRRYKTIDNYFIHSFDTTNLVEFADTILEDDFGLLFETRIVNWLNKILSIVNPNFIYSKLTLDELKEKVKDQSNDGKTNTMNVVTLKDTANDINRGISEQSTLSYTNLNDSLDAKDKYRKGHKICCGYCTVTFSMILFSIIMAGIVGIGGWNIWTIGETPMIPTIEDILSFTEKMIAAETEYIVERALFSTQQFIDFTKVVPNVTVDKQNNILFDRFLSDELIASPRFDGIIQLKSFNNITTDIQASFIFKKQTDIDQSRVDYTCDITIDNDNSNNNNDLSTQCQKLELIHIANKLWQSRQNGIVTSQINTFFISDQIIDGNEYQDGTIWFITWRFVNNFNANTKFIIGGMFRSSRINSEYQKLALSKEGVVYWITNDKYQDVFLTSLANEDLHIAQHHTFNSSINLDSTFGFALNLDYDGNNVDIRISNTMNNIGDKHNDSLIANDYYIYYELQKASFGSFFVVIVFPYDIVYDELIFSQKLVIVFISLAMIFAILNACIANAVPFIPIDDSWLATPLFTEQDRKELNDNMDWGKQMGDLHKADSKETLEMNHYKHRRGNIEPQKKPIPMVMVKSKTKNALSSLNVFDAGKQNKDKDSTIFKPMVVQQMDIPLAPIANSHRDKDAANIINGSISTTIMTEKSNDDIDNYNEEEAKSNQEAFNRQRSNSDQISSGKKKKKSFHSSIDSKQDAIQKMQALSNEMMLQPQKGTTRNHTKSIPLKKGSNKANLPHANTDLMSSNYGYEKKDEFNSDNDINISDGDYDDGPIPSGPKRAVSVGTGLQNSSQLMALRKRRENEKKRKAEIKRVLSEYKKKQQRDQLQRNINHANMRSIFSREENTYKTKYGQRMNTAINLICFLIAAFVLAAYLMLRSFTQTDIGTVMDSHLKISNIIVENHAEFKVYQHGLALQQGQRLITEFDDGNDTENDILLHEFYNLFNQDELTGVFSFRGQNRNITDLTIYSSATLDSNDDDDEECVVLDQIESSFLAICIHWKPCDASSESSTKDITDCSLYSAIQETYENFIDSKVDDPDILNSIAFSLPFACFGGQKICYVGLTKTKREDDDSLNGPDPMFIGALLSMHGLADTARDIVYEKSGMQSIVDERETVKIAYKNIKVDFSFYIFTNLSNNSNGDDYYLLAATDNEVITTSQTTYGHEISSIMKANDSTNDEVQRTWFYLYETGQFNEEFESTIAWSSWSFPKMVYYKFENDEGINWVSVITISAEVFLGDHTVYATLGSITTIGWLVIYLFIHFISYRRFQDNISQWEQLYLKQIEQEMFPLLGDDEVDIIEDDDDINDDTEEPMMQQISPSCNNNMNNNNNNNGGNNNNNGFNKDIDEQLTLDFISANIRDTVRGACQQSWIRQQSTNDIYQSELPTKRKDITDHYHKRALRHIYQAKEGMNIITVVQMEQFGQSKVYRLRLYGIQSSRYWRWFMKLLLFIHCILVFWRPLTEEALQNEGYKIIPLTIEWICIIFECIDLILFYFISFEWQDTSKNPLMSPSQQKRIFSLRVIVWSLILIDVLLIMFIKVSITRFLPLRPVLLILWNDRLVGACYALAITSINAADALLLLAMLLAIAAVSGVILFRFNPLMDYYNVYTFQNFIRSIFTTYVFIISGENYGELVYTSFNKSPVLIIFFLVLTVLGSWIVVSLVVSRFQTSFKEIYNRERERRIYFKRTGYVAAFSLINLDDDNEVDKNEFKSFVTYLKEETKRKREKKQQRHNKKNKKILQNFKDNVDSSSSEHTEIAEQLLNNFSDFETFDQDGDDSIDIREFVTKLEEIYQRPTLIDIINDDDSLLSWIRLNIVETEAFSQFVLCIILIELILFSLYGIYPGQRSTQMLDLVLGITVLLNGLDIIVKIFSMGWDYYWNTSKCRIINRHKTVKNNKQQKDVNKEAKHHQRNTSSNNENDELLNGLITTDDDDNNVEYEESVYTQDPLHLKQREFAHRFDLVIVAMAIIGFIISRAFIQKLWFDDEFNPYRIVMIIPLLRLFTLIKTTRSAVYIITKVIPRFTSLVLILLMLFYIYAVIGVWLIGDDLQTKLLNEPQYSFATFPKSLITLFQLTVGEGWHDVMYDTVYAKNSLLSTTGYFATFVLLITLIFTNLFVGLVISVVDDVEQENRNKLEVYKQQKEQQQIQKQQQQRQQTIIHDDDNIDLPQMSSQRSNNISHTTPHHHGGLVFSAGNPSRRNNLSRRQPSKKFLPTKSKLIL